MESRGVIIIFSSGLYKRQETYCDLCINAEVFFAIRGYEFTHTAPYLHKKSHYLCVALCFLKVCKEPRGSAGITSRCKRRSNPSVITSFRLLANPFCSVRGIFPSKLCYPPPKSPSCEGDF